MSGKDTISLIQSLEQIPPAQSFLLDTFFTSTENHNSEIIEIDVVKGSRRLAPFVRPVSEARLSLREGFVSDTIKIPYIKLKRPLEVKDSMQRMPGENPYAGISPEARARAIRLKDYAEMRTQIQRREEWMAAKGLLDGEVTCKGEDIEATADFKMTGTHKTTLLTPWTDAASDPIKDIRTWKRLITKDSGLTANIMIFGNDVTDAFLANEVIDKILNNRRYEAGSIDITKTTVGVSPVGSILGLNIYEYDEWFVDPDTGLSMPLIPADTILIGSTQARCTRHYGVIQDVQALIPVAYYPKSWIEQDPGREWNMLQSAPLPIPHQIDAFMSVVTV